jgi:adenylate kinase
LAKIYPQKPPQLVLDDPKRNAELKVFQSLKSLPDPYVIFYSSHWQKHNVYDGVQEGEADFIIAHPEMGFIVLEVKGGAIYYKADSDQWYSQDRNGENHPIKNPVEQARKSHYLLVDELSKLPGWPERKINFWHAVCFPDSLKRPGQVFSLDLPNEQLVDLNDLADINKSVGDLFQYCFGAKMPDNAPGTKLVGLAESLLANSFELKTPLGVDLERDDQKLVELTERQFQALTLLGKRKRVAIAGCAGSGKTMLAVKKVQQFCQLGLTVLLVCYNSALAEYLETRLYDATVANFHSLCQQAASQLGRKVTQETDQKKLFEDVYPQVLMEFAETTGRVYDAIVVDEGQDFHENYWIALESLLKTDGYLFIFYDDNQNLFHGQTNFGGLISEEPFSLNQNCRNTKRIHNTVMKFHNDPSGIVSYAPEGTNPEWIIYSDQADMHKALQKKLHQLVNEEDVSAQDIVILTPKGKNRTSLTPGLKLGNFVLTERSTSQPTQIMTTTIQRFKGLERKVIIMTELDQSVRFDLEMLMYVGCSRARTHLIVLHDAALSFGAL